MATLMVVKPLHKDPIRLAALERSEQLKHQQLFQELLRRINEKRIK